MSVVWIAVLAGAIWCAGLVLVIGLCVSAKRGDSGLTVAEPRSAQPAAEAFATVAEVGVPRAATPGERREPFRKRFVCLTCGAHMRRPTTCQVCLGSEFAVTREQVQRVAGTAP